mmetsp:Transcript_91111/g.262728  ORF Transcript_91111/g.262728 Transcript_91111/m.262728 type:complete len:200 (-) Transcript_91111:1264-1863(-)
MQRPQAWNANCRCAEGRNANGCCAQCCASGCCSAIAEGGAGVARGVARSSCRSHAALWLRGPCRRPHRPGDRAWRDLRLPPWRSALRRRPGGALRLGNARHREDGLRPAGHPGPRRRASQPQASICLRACQRYVPQRAGRCLRRDLPEAAGVLVLLRRGPRALGEPGVQHPRPLLRRRLRIQGWRRCSRRGSGGRGALA